MLVNSGRHFCKGSQIPTFADDDIVLRLFTGRFCPYCQRVHLVLEHKNIPYHTINCNLADKPEWLFEKNPLGKIPALELPNEEGSPVIADSLAICEYLDEKYPQKPLLSQDPLQKLNDKNLVEKFGASSSVFFKVFMLGPAKSPGCIEETTEFLKEFEKELENRKTSFFGGGKPSWVDYMIWPWFERLALIKHVYGEEHELDFGKVKNLAKWIGLMTEDSTVKRFYLDGETHAKYLKSYHAGNVDVDMLVKQ